jgi:hypothetical protein
MPTPPLWKINPLRATFTTLFQSTRDQWDDFSLPNLNLPAIGFNLSRQPGFSGSLKPKSLSARLLERVCPLKSFNTFVMLTTTLSSADTANYVPEDDPRQFGYEDRDCNWHPRSDDDGCVFEGALLQTMSPVCSFIFAVPEYLIAINYKYYCCDDDDDDAKE